MQWPLTRSRQRELLKSFQYLKKETQKTLQSSTFNLGQIYWFQNICSKLDESFKKVLQRYNHYVQFKCGKSLLFNIWLDVLLLLNSDVTLRRESLQSLSSCCLSLFSLTPSVTLSTDRSQNVVFTEPSLFLKARKLLHMEKIPKTYKANNFIHFQEM